MGGPTDGPMTARITNGREDWASHIITYRIPLYNMTHTPNMHGMVRGQVIEAQT